MHADSSALLWRLRSICAVSRKFARPVLCCASSGVVCLSAVRSCRSQARGGAVTLNLSVQPSAVGCSSMRAAELLSKSWLNQTRTFESWSNPLLTARRLPLDAEKHAFRAFAGGQISQKKIKARFESVVCSTAILGVGSTRLHPSSSDATLPARTHAWCKTGCPAPAVAAFPPGEP